MHGFFLIDKPSGITSFDILRKLRKILGTRKMGHTGTLDPLATGGILVAVGNYTKLIPYFEKDRKTYRASIMLDGTSASFDTDTEVEYISEEQQQTFSNTLEQSHIESVIASNFVGDITQVPPKVSAVKINGKRALDRLREGEEFEIKSRDVTVYSFNIVSYSYPELVADIEVSAGTYIRSLARDLGEILGTGGYLSALRRTKIGKLDIVSAHEIEDTTWDKKMDETLLFQERTFVTLDDEKLLWRLTNGQEVFGEFDFPQNEEFFVMTEFGIQYVLWYDGNKLISRKKVF